MSDNSEAQFNTSIMRESDLADVMAVELGNYEFPWTHGIFTDCVRAGYICRVLRSAGTLAGYSVSQVIADEAHLLNLCIDRKFSGRGLARKMLEQLTELVAQQGAKMQFLEVRQSNRRAIELYVNAGFNEIGLRKDYYDAAGGREDAIVMARSI